MNSDRHLLPVGSTIREALAQLNELGNFLTLFIIQQDQKLIGTITDGDIRRAMLRGSTLNEKIDGVMNKNFTFLRSNAITLDELDKIRKKQLKMIPVVEDGRIVRLINLEKLKTILPIDAVIMAGGEGRRLRPLTDHTPKPMLKIGNKPIIEYNVDRLAQYGVENCFITTKYLGNQIQEYLGNGAAKEMNIQYVQEDSSPLGTIGSVSLINSFVQEHVLIMNSDLLTNIDFEDFFVEFKNNDADMAVATVPYQVKIPYAVIETDENLIRGLREKPTYTYHSNAGIYLLKKDVLKLIPKSQHYNATDLISHLISIRKKVITYALFCYWLDIGKPEDFQKAQEDINHIKF